MFDFEEWLVRSTTNGSGKKDSIGSHVGALSRVEARLAARSLGRSTYRNTQNDKDERD
jgi:hypothetical protein